MRSWNGIINGLLILAVVILYVLHFNHTLSQVDKPVKNGNYTVDSLKVSSGNMRSVYLNTDSLDANYLLVKDMRDELAAEKIKYESQLSSRLKSLEKEVIQFQEKARFMTQTEGEQRQMELAQKEQDLMKLEQDLTSKIVESEKERNKIIQKNVSDYLQKMNEQENYHFIFGYNGWGNLLLGDTTLDITSQVISGLNQEYLLQKKE